MLWAAGTLVETDGSATVATMKELRIVRTGHCVTLETAIRITNEPENGTGLVLSGAHDGVVFIDAIRRGAGNSRPRVFEKRICAWRAGLSIQSATHGDCCHGQ